MIWTQPCPSPGRFISTFAVSHVRIWRMAMLKQHCAGAAFFTYLVVIMLNNGATKGQVARRWLELNPAPVQKTVFQLLQWSLLEFGKWCRATSWQSCIFYLYWWWKCWIKVVPKGEFLEDELNSTLHQSRKVYINFCNGACWNLTNDERQSQERFIWRFNCRSDEWTSASC